MLWPSLRQRTVNRVLVNPICIYSRDHDLVGEPNGRSYSKSIRILNFGFVMWKMDDRSTEIDSSSNVSDEENHTTGKILMFYDWITLYWWCGVVWCALANFSISRCRCKIWWYDHLERFVLLSPQNGNVKECPLPRDCLTGLKWWQIISNFRESYFKLW